VVPVGLAGTREVFPKGKKLPRRSAVAVAFGEPRSFAPEASAQAIAEELRHDVCRLAADAQENLAASRPTVYERVASFARSRAALWLVFGWAVAEAMWWPLIPDFFIAPLALAAPGRVLLLAGVATAGSVTGGTVAFHLGGVGEWLASTAPLLTPRMHGQAVVWMSEQGVGALLQQPLSGIPYKVFALHAADVGLALPAFVAMSVAARGLRIVAVAAIFAGGGVALRRLWPRIFGLFLVAYCIVFAFGLSATVRSWR
jgi:membrane protein YqaA with SNARE-associated domain